MIEQFFNDQRHVKSEEIAFFAERSERSGDSLGAERKYAEAAGLEEEVARTVPFEIPRVRSLLAISAVSLWLKARRWDDAARVACSFLINPEALTQDGRRDLEALLERAWRARDLANGSTGNHGYAALEAKLDGGLVRRGIAPTTVVRDRSEVIVQLLMRVVELEAKKKFRKSGRSSYANKYAVVEAPAQAASYTVRLFLGLAGQQETSTVPEDPNRVVARFLELAAAAASGSEELRRQVPDEDYSKAFLRGFRDLSADGPAVGFVELSSGRPRDIPVRLPPAVRENLSVALRPRIVVDSDEYEMVGVLKQVKLSPEPSIGVEADGAICKFRLRAGEQDDTIGPKLNRTVRVRARPASDPGADPWAEDVVLLEDQVTGEPDNDQLD